ncbi:MAG: hypothetical protein J4G05_10155 [Chlorobi bacterium]|nr:hypothetical protein [Chlorobiota bacterium]
MKGGYNYYFRWALLCGFASLIIVGLGACEGSSGPISTPIPQGTFTRVISLGGGKELHSMIQLELDSTFITDTVYSFPGGVTTVDSTHSIQLELNPAGDGYFRAVEEHRTPGSNITENILRYWFFFERGDSLLFYRGMRFQGNNNRIEGSWRLSFADSSFIGMSYTYVFTEDSVTITRISGTGAVHTTSAYALKSDTLSITENNVSIFGDRLEIIPGLALYITSHADKGYKRSNE